MDHVQRLSFGGVAALYDRARPSYPAALVEDVIDLAPLGAPLRALEIGAGTGKATELFARHGVAVHAIEPSLEMAEVAALRLAELPGVTLECCDFEEWDGEDVTFPLIYAAQAWHWVEPETGYVKARSLLQAGGLLAAFWNRPKWDSCPWREELIDAYMRALPDRSAEDPMHPAAASDPDVWEEWARAIEGTPGLGRPKVRGYGWAQRYSTGEYLQLLQTHSPNIMLSNERLETLLIEVGRVLDAHGGEFELNYVTWLYLARAQ
ncbi:MAG TPA: methyltransferase domain-containing protein [Solirubrobacteraceae bacterium]|nr:methyltransferase domain-containing protein [Solirubrobacteraceae bacterium]